MVMFGKAIERIGAKPVRPRRLQRMIINALPLVFQRGSMLWVAALIGEEIFDSLQRQMMDDPELQPMIQRLMRIHVTEEARHIQFARDGARKRVTEMPRLNRWFMANINGVGGYFFRYLFSNPIPYARVGLDAQAGTKDRAHQPAPPRSAGRRLRPAGGVSDRDRPDGPDRAPQLEAHQLSVTQPRPATGRHRRRRGRGGASQPSCGPPASPTSPSCPAAK